MTEFTTTPPPWIGLHRQDQSWSNFSTEIKPNATNVNLCIKKSPYDQTLSSQYRVRYL